MISKLKKQLFQKCICFVLVASMVFTSSEAGFNTSVRAAQLDDVNFGVDTLVNEFGNEKDDSFPRGGMCTPFTFSDEEIATHEISEDALNDLVTPEEIAETERDLAADLQTYCEQKNGVLPDFSNETISGNDVISETSVSTNTVEKLSAETLGYATIEDAAAYLRSQMVKRKTLVTVKLAKGPDSAQRNIQKIFMSATEYYEGCTPREGDYIFWNIMGYAWKKVKSDRETETYRIQILWRSDAAQEAWVTNKISEIITALDLRNPQKSEYEKVSQIYDYIMDSITYDTYNYTYNQTTFMPMYTVYYALTSGKGVCQAYALLFYRLCREVGIEARLISGNDNESGVATHGWNIVRIGDYYYNVDATWDDEISDRRMYFLKNTADFSGHSRNKSCNSTAYHSQFPMAPTSYEEPLKLTMLENLTSSMQSLTSQQVSTSPSPGKCKMLYFFHGDESGSSMALTNISKLSEMNSNACDIIIYDLMTPMIYTQLFIKYNVSETDYANRLLEKLGNPTNVSYVKQSDLTRSLRNQYAALGGKREENGFLGVLIDANNQVRYVAGISELSKMESAYRLVAGTSQMQSMGAVNIVQTKNNQVAVSWTPYPGAIRYYIYRKDSTNNYCCVGSTDGNVYLNTVTPGMAYSYKVYASNGMDFIAESNESGIAPTTMYVRKGTSVTVNGYKYKILSSNASKKTVAFAGVKDSKVTKVIIPQTVKIDGLTYKVTEIANNALKNKKQVKVLSIGSNVQKIGSGACMGCKKLVQIVVKGKQIKTVGKNAFKNTAKNVVIFVPGSKLAAYKKKFAGKGLGAKASIKK